MAMRPYSTLQQALDAATNGDTILIRPGIYAGAGNYALDFHRKSLSLRNADSHGEVVIDCNGLGQAMVPQGTAGSNVMLDGLTIKRGSSDAGGALRMESGRFVLRDCTVSDGWAPAGEAFSCAFSNLVVLGLDMQSGSGFSNEPNVARFSFSNAQVEDEFHLGAGRYELVSTRFDGPGGMVMNPETVLVVVNRYAAAEATIIRTNLFGPGRIEIEPGQQLILEGHAQVDLRADEECAPGGEIDVYGSLLVRENASLENANVRVYVLDIEDCNRLFHNDSRLIEASTGFGGELFADGSASVIGNTITSEGDRYLDLDPDPDEPYKPVISNNRICVEIDKSPRANEGGLLELRAKDYDQVGRSGTFPVDATSPRFTTDPAENWVLERLELKAGAKLNLTNRQGFGYVGGHEPETVYVKELVLGENAVLNTALQTSYYQRLMDSDGSELIRDWNDPYAPLANGSRFQDIPLLGFSLGVIGMNDQKASPHNEFDIRGRKRLTHRSDPQPILPDEPKYVGAIARVIPDAGLSGNGVMEMRTQISGTHPAKSVAPKGTFSRAGDEDITIEFDYLFLEDPNDDAELIVYLSDHPEVSEGLIEVARIRPPMPGHPGAVGSGRFAVFSGRFERGALNFTRGSYVELELRGKGACCWIDNWDPQIVCGAPKCGDYDANGWLLPKDFLLMLSEFDIPDPNKGCLDAVDDGCVSTDDLLVWDSPALHACPGRTRVAAMLNHADRWAYHDRPRLSPPLEIVPGNHPLLVYGKRMVLSDYPDSLLTPCQLSNTLRGLTYDGNNVESELSSSAPGRLSADHEHQSVLQINNGEEVVCLDTQQTVVKEA